MKRWSSIVLSSLFVGCAAHVGEPDPNAAPAPPAAAPSDKQAIAPTARDARPSDERALAVRSTEDNLARLRDLRVFDVLGAIQHLPEAANCYSLPCPGHEAEFAAAIAADARALTAFTDTVVAAAALPVALPDASRAPPPAEDEANLQALRGLSIVDVGALIVEEPKLTGNCYGVCPADAAAAEKLQREREVRLANITHALIK